MTVVSPSYHTAVSENWDDDFEFQTGIDAKRPGVGLDDSRLPHTASHRSLSNGVLDDTNVKESPASQSLSQEWAKPGPSTPSRRVTPPPSENWDEDFEDKADSADAPNGFSPPRPKTLSRTPKTSQEPENWDDDFEIDKGNSPTRDANWGSSDDEGGMGYADQEDDRTVTARSRRVALPKQSPPPPVPSLPPSILSAHEPFPGSPTMSIFSVPSGRDSIAHSYASHVPLRAGSSSALAILPPSPPIHKERRRLRKKSRPPDHNLFELLDRDRDSIQAPSPPQSLPTEYPATPPEHSVPKGPLLSRIGSVKKWGVRRKRASTDPTDVMLNEIDSTPRPSSSTSNHHSHSNSPSSSHKPSGWFFRSGGGGADMPGSPPPPSAADLKHERSIDRLKAFSNTFETPTRTGQKPLQQLGFHPNGSSGSRGSTPDQTPPPSPMILRRPSSMQVPQAKPLFPRHTSHGAMTVGRSASRSTFSTSTDDFDKDRKGKEKEKEEGHRGFMGGMRRISLVGSQKKHKKMKSTAGQDHESVPATPAIVIPQLPDTAGPSQPDQLLPPIELKPPSPRISNGREAPSANDEPDSISSNLDTSYSRPSVETSSSVHSQVVALPLSPPVKLSTSPHAASLGRSAQVPSTSSITTAVPRRNSLGDLKIPARISQAQVGLKRDLGMVREFAASVEKLKELQSIYHSLVYEVHVMITDSASRPPSRAKSPTFFSHSRSRARSNTNPTPASEAQKHIATTYSTIDSKYKISWECAELLIELGGGNPVPVSPPSSAPASTPESIADMANSRPNRERAITLGGDESKPPLPPSSTIGPPMASPPNLGWRASTGRNDLSQRQLWLLRDMLNNPDSSVAMSVDSRIPEEGAVNRGWRWGDPMSSTVTLPSEESVRTTSPSKKRRSSRLGMSGLRDMLRSLTRGHGQSQMHQTAFQTPSAAASTESSLDSHGHPQPVSQSGHSSQRRRSKTSAGPDSTSASMRATSPFNTSASYTHKSSPRRPSLASIFRFAQKNKSLSGESSQTPGVSKNVLHSSSSGSDFGSPSKEEEEDWDRLDSAADLDAAAKALGLGKDGTATIRGRKARSPYLADAGATPRKNTTASQSSISLWNDSPPSPAHPARVPSLSRPTRLSNVEESAESDARGSRVKGKGSARKTRTEAPSASPHRRPSGRRGTMSGSVRSAPPSSFTPGLGSVEGTDPKLAMTPENIRPLLENAKEVHAKCAECIEEMKVLLAIKTS